MDNPIIVILGPTASGKSAAALKLAQKYNGEIIAADSRTIYKEMDVGTAKPTKKEQSKIQHHGLDLINPDQTFSAAEFQKYATQKVQEIHDKDKRPIIVGGTGLYIDGYVYKYTFASKPDAKLRQKLNKMSLEDLQQLATQKGIEHNKNPRHLARAIERAGEPISRKPKPEHVLMLGLNPGIGELTSRIDARVDTMFADGLVKEVQDLINKYDADAPGLQAPGYKAVRDYIDGTASLDETKEQFKKNDRDLAKRQITWFKRNSDIVWCSDFKEAEDNLRAFLRKFATITT